MNKLARAANSSSNCTTLIGGLTLKTTIKVFFKIFLSVGVCTYRNKKVVGETPTTKKNMKYLRVFTQGAAAALCRSAFKK